MPDTIGYASFAGINDTKYEQPQPVPLYIANEENTKEYGNLFTDYEAEEITLRAKSERVRGWRQAHEGPETDNEAITRNFRSWWADDLSKATGNARLGEQTSGRLPGNVSHSNRTYLLTREANYHPDESQSFYSPDKKPYILVLALPGDDVKVEMFKAFYFDGSAGFQIKVGIWHQGALSVEDDAALVSKRGKVHAAVLLDTVDEFGKFLKVPLKPELAENN